MKRHKTMLTWEVFIVALLASGTVWGASPQLSLRYDEAAPADAAEAVRIYEAEVPPVAGTVYVYATIQMGPVNPINYVDGLPEWRPESTPAPAGADQGAGAEEDDGMGGFIMKEHHPPAPGREGRPQFLETVTLGHNTDGQFIPVVRFGLADDGRAQEQAMVCPWLSDGYIDYFGGYARPHTPYDFKLRLDLDNKRMSAWISGRGDDDWFLLAEDVALTTNAAQIDRAQVEMYPGGPPVEQLMVRSKPWAPAERVQLHPLAKEDCVVGRGRGFTFQSLRSTWRQPGKHVTIARVPGHHHGFPDVVRAGPNHLVCAWRDGSHTGGGGDMSVAHSYDLGQTWSERQPVYHGSANCPRIQKLNDGSLLMCSAVGGYKKVALWRSTDEGHTWSDPLLLDPVAAGGKPKIWVPSHILELPDGSWLVQAGWVSEGEAGAECLQFYRSPDRGKTWHFVSELRVDPYNLSESSLMQLPDGRLLIYSREARSDFLPAIKAYSEDGGKTWDVHELAFPMSSRISAILLSDGRAMVTYRSQIGRAALRAWIGDPDDSTPCQPTGGHFNDRYTVGLKDGALHIYNDGMRGQFTKYNLRAPDTSESTVDVTAEVQVVANHGRAATLSVPFAGKFRLFPDHVEMAHDPTLRVEVTPGESHTYQIISRVGNMKLYVDGELALDTDKADSQLRRWGSPFSRMLSPYDLSFGNEARGINATDAEVARTMPDVYMRHITPEVTGYSIWRRVEAILDDPQTGRRALSWSAEEDGFPDQYQLDHIIEVEASVSGHEQGYSGLIELDDGRIFVVHYTDDTAPVSRPNPHNMGVPWIRGTFLEPSDLPPVGD